MNDNLAILVQRTDGFLEVAFADTKQAADQRGIALVVDRQGAIVLAQLGEDLRVQTAGCFLANRLQAQADLAVGANFLDEPLLSLPARMNLKISFLWIRPQCLLLMIALKPMSVASATSKSTSWPAV